MVAFEAGNFTLGTTGVAVDVRAFCIDRVEVTVERYAACVGAKACKGDRLDQKCDFGAECTPTDVCNYPRADRRAHPMNCVSAADAETYCAAQGHRLPTEAEWEWAAGGGPLASKYPWGSAPPREQLCWSGVVQRKGTCPIASFPSGQSAAGVHDLLGNVWEWTSSHDAGGQRVLRGGSWVEPAIAAPDTSTRSYISEGHTSGSIGFRCAR